MPTYGFSGGGQNTEKAVEVLFRVVIPITALSSFGNKETNGRTADHFDSLMSHRNSRDPFVGIHDLTEPYSTLKRSKGPLYSVGKRSQVPGEVEDHDRHVVENTEFPTHAIKTHARRSSPEDNEASNIKGRSREAASSYTDTNPFILSNIIQRNRRFPAPSDKVSPGGDARQMRLRRMLMR